MTLAEFNEKLKIISYLVPFDKLKIADVKVRAKDNKTFGIHSIDMIERSTIGIDGTNAITKSEGVPTYIIQCSSASGIKFNELYKVFCRLTREETLYAANTINVKACSYTPISDGYHLIKDITVSIDMHTGNYIIWIELQWYSFQSNSIMED